MLELQLVGEDHRSELLRFELENRDYFARSISDRGDDYFAEFTERHHEFVAEQDAGIRAGYVLVDVDGSIVGRFNLSRIQDGVAEVGYRVAERVAGRGVATAGLEELCHQAASRHGLQQLRAATGDQNVASRRVLIKAGFTPAGPADPADIGGRHGRWYHRDLT